jgi:hypothetical protein
MTAPHIRLCQSDPQWAGILLGRSPTVSIGEQGCAVTAVAIADRALGSRAGATPPEVCRRGRARSGVWAPGKAGAVMTELIRAQGLVVGVDFDGPGKVAGTKTLKAAIYECVRDGGVAVVCVDHDKGKPNGDDIGDHWGTITAIDLAGDTATLIDPATGQEVQIVWRTLVGVTEWSGKPKTLTVTRAITVFRG